MRRKLFADLDWGVLGFTMLLPALGLIVLYSAGYDPDARLPYFSWLPISISSPAFAKQITFLFGGLGILVITLLAPPSLYFRYAYLLYGVSIALLILVAKFGIIVNGSRRWLDLGPFNLQAAEVVKLGVVFALARYLSKHQPPVGGYGFKSLIAPCLFFIVPMAFILKQPDLGSALVVGGIGFLMILFVGINPKKLLLIVVAAVVLVVPAYQFALHDYQKRRIEILLNPESDPQGSGYHITQSKIAVGSGAVFGKGFLQGTQTQLQFLPEHTTDFIFSVLAEEWGFFGCALILSLYLLLFYKMFRLIGKLRDSFSALICFGIVAKIFVNLAVNVGMVIGLLPVVGIPMPLFSYGGSSIVSSFLGIGLVLGIGMRRRAFARGL